MEMQRLKSDVAAARQAHEAATTTATNEQLEVQAAELDETLSAGEFERKVSSAREAARQAKIAAARVSEAERRLADAERSAAEAELAAIEKVLNWSGCKARLDATVQALVAGLERLRPLANKVDAECAEQERLLARARELSAVAGRPSSAVIPNPMQRQAIALEAASVAAQASAVDLGWARVEPDPQRRAATVLQAFGAGQARSVDAPEHARRLLASGDPSVVLGPESAALEQQRLDYDHAEREAAQKEFERRRALHFTDGSAL